MESILKEIRKEFVGQEVRLSELYYTARIISERMGAIEPMINTHAGLCSCSFFKDENTEVNVNISFDTIYDEEYFEDFAKITDINAICL